VDEHHDQDPQRPDEAYARLRAADPAADATLDTAALRAEVARRAGGDADGAAAPGAVATTAGSLDSLGSRRRARWLQVAAVGVGAALVAGAGGYAVGATGNGPDTVAAGAITLGSGAAPMEGAADAPATADMRIGPWFGGRTVFSAAAGLTDEAASGHAWGLDPAAVFSAETAARVAGVLGIAGDPRLEYGSWSVGSSDGTGPSLSLQPDGSGSVSYFDPTRDPWSCTASATDTPDAGAGTDGADTDGAGTDGAGTDGAGTDGAATSGATAEPFVVDPAPPAQPACDPTTGDAPTGDAAVASTRDVLTSLGVDAAAFEYEVTDAGTPRAVTVLAYHVLDGQRTGLSWNVTLVGDGVQSLYGWLAPLVDLGEYPVVGAATAVERLNDPRFGASSTGVVPLAREAATDDSATMVEPSGDPTPPSVARPGAPIDWPVQQVTITDARLGLTQVFQADGSTLLVPAYELTGSDGSTWSVVAVDEGSLDLAG
jgi:hypothetical protein